MCNIKIHVFRKKGKSPKVFLDNNLKFHRSKRDQWESIALLLLPIINDLDITIITFFNGTQKMFKAYIGNDLEKCGVGDSDLRALQDLIFSFCEKIGVVVEYHKETPEEFISNLINPS